MEEAAKTAKQSAESVSKGGEKLGRTAAFKALSQVSWLPRSQIPDPGSRLLATLGVQGPAAGRPARGARRWP